MSKNIVVILCGGNGTRMKSDIPKVLHKINGKSMILHLIEKCLFVNPEKIMIVVNNTNRQKIIDEIFNYGYMTNKIYFVLQQHVKGTGDALKCCCEKLLDYLDSNVLILNGDVPLLKIKTIQTLVGNINNNNILVCKVNLAEGYGRIICDSKNKFLNIVEDKDCNENEKKINLVNAGIYSFECRMILKYIDKLNDDNIQNEYYITDLPQLISKEKEIHLIYSENEEEILGINTKEQLDYINSSFYD